jgi:hypothetical protein
MFYNQDVLIDYTFYIAISVSLFKNGVSHYFYLVFLLIEILGLIETDCPTISIAVGCDKKNAASLLDGVHIEVGIYLFRL